MKSCEHDRLGSAVYNSCSSRLKSTFVGGIRAPFDRGWPDQPENYHTLVYTLTATDDGTHLELTQDGCDSQEQAAQFSQNWQGMLDALKTHVED